MTSAYLPGEIATAGHRARIGYEPGGLDEAGWFDTTCSCGWTSIWSEALKPVNAPTEEHGFTPEWAARINEAGGVRHWNTEHPGQRFGRHEDVLEELLMHLGVDPLDMKTQACKLARDRERELRDLLCSTPGEDLMSFVARIDAARDALVEARRLSECLVAAHFDSAELLPAGQT